MATAEEDDIAARFAAIVSPIAPTMNWGTDLDPEVDGENGIGTARSEPAPDTAEREAREREARREQRRLERARELAEYQAAKAELEAEYNSDDDHFTPPEPPPLPKLRPVTVGAMLLVLIGIALIAVPTLLVIDTQLTMVLGLILVAGGAITLLSRLRHNDDDSDSGAVL